MASSVGIGIDIGEHQIRVVRLRRTQRGVVLQGMGSLPTPSGAISAGNVGNPRLLAEALRRALRTYGIKGSAAVAGLPGRAAASRVLDLPVMHREELGSVIAGEMEHYRMIPMNQGTFDFVPLGEPVEEGRRQKILVMAADARVVEGYRDALRLAGLQLSALEPVSIAASRAVFANLERGGVALVTIGARSGEFAVFHGGSLRYLRQLDVGSLELSQDKPSGLPEQPVEVEAEPETDVSGPALPRLAGGASPLESFAYEVQRSIDFYHRETGQSARVERLLLCVDTERLPDLERHLQGALAIPVSLCSPFEGVLYSEERFSSGSINRVGPAYSPAVGLALRAIEEAPRAPRMDLSSAGPESRLARTAPRWLTWGLVASIVAVLAVIVSWLTLQSSLQRRQADLTAARAELAQVAKLEQERTSAAKRAQEARQIVQLRGLPWSEILFHVSASMPDRVWLTSLQLQSGNVLGLDGVALSAASVATLMESLTRSSLFSMPQMSSITKQASAGRSVVKYQVKVAVSSATSQAPDMAGGAPLSTGSERGGTP